MQQEVLSKQLDFAALLHDVSNIFKGTSLVLNQIIDGAYGHSLEEIRPFLIKLQEMNERGKSLADRKTIFLEHNSMAAVQFDMFDFLQRNYFQYQAIAQCHSLNLHYQTQALYKHGTQVRADSISIERMLCNLVTNAIKYTKKGDIFLRLLNQEDDLVIEIEDTGCGIAAEQLSNIFIPFWRSPQSRLSDKPGRGMGLYIAWMVAYAHGLSMRVDSVATQGTKFTIIFPCKDDGIYGIDDRMLPKSPKQVGSRRSEVGSFDIKKV
ncbi:MULTISPECIES: cell wall metabolism sensor histidine kinase WalK [Nostoc]|uniref:histidine kinase n=1 Tax=Nostoc paludosum FACHB-159 TaxID=2692908 RepID=A0ABR8KHP4_9NOSO|nr:MULTISPECIES: ATP-binding protein [Nostoc]MBD2681922.1 sensor histidine kinase [Nostoc sp. FACHB-857]MBD2738249.1 sensor histidine kinase [Nostoc paludosum FACHB-159]